MKVHVFAPNIVIDITFYWFEAGQKLVHVSSIAIDLLLQDGQRNLCDCFSFDHDRTTLPTTDNTPSIHVLGIMTVFRNCSVINLL